METFERCDICGVKASRDVKVYFASEHLYEDRCCFWGMAQPSYKSLGRIFFFVKLSWCTDENSHDEELLAKEEWKCI